MVSMTTVESLACECAEMAYYAEQDGCQGFAEALRVFSHKHRIKALEIAGKLALLEEQHRNLLRPKAGPLRQPVPDPQRRLQHGRCSGTRARRHR
ncbi:hypothetical protein VQ02_19455 [Methylobacterium variabile]|uniref:Uncharacterized protein n=1 Tax=Methylobacterium variabile TaxID=298794 RepID=A0A0J6SKQ4_9HYPH|nr:hypothetical protein VQ02_19455 [Methylobacterium variabile]